MCGWKDGVWKLEVVAEPCKIIFKVDSGNDLDLFTWNQLLIEQSVSCLKFSLGQILPRSSFQRKTLKNHLRDIEIIMHSPKASHYCVHDLIFNWAITVCLKQRHFKSIEYITEEHSSHHSATLLHHTTAKIWKQTGLKRSDSAFFTTYKTYLPGLRNQQQTHTEVSAVWFDLNVLPTVMCLALSYKLSVLVYLATMLLSETWSCGQLPLPLSFSSLSLWLWYHSMSMPALVKNSVLCKSCLS